MSSTKTAIFICGPTGIGKTALSVEIAKWLNTEIISFDSRQFFKELAIGSAPPSPEELAAVPHHFIGHLSIADHYSAGEFETAALGLADSLFEQNDTLVFVGGSGLYMKALLEGFDSMPDIRPEVREELNNEFRQSGLETLVKELLTNDPEYYEKVDTKNPQRVIRALEVIRSSGKTYTSFRKEKKRALNFEPLKIGLELDREVLYERINKRVDQMVEAGLEAEVSSLVDYRDANAMQTVGYKEFINYFDQVYDRETAIAEIKKNSRRYAKRQLTWFRRDPEIKWFSPMETDLIKDHIKKHI